MTYLTVAEAAQILKVSEKTIYRRVRDGSLGAAKFGALWRIRQDALPTEIRRHSTPPPRPAAVKGEFGQIARQVTGASKGGGR